MKIVDYKVPNGKMLKIKLESKNEEIKSVIILGDFFLHPESTIEDIESALIGCKIDTLTISKIIQDVLESSDSTLIGAQPSDIAKAIEKAFLE